VLDAEVEMAAAKFRHGKPAVAVQLLRAIRRKAEKLPPDDSVRSVVARTMISEAGPHFDMSGDLDASLALLDEADAIIAEVDNPVLKAKAAGQRALVVLRSGDTERSLPLFDAAAALLDRAAPRDRALIMLNRGVLHLEHARLAEAEDDLARSVTYAENAGDDRLAAMARHNLGYVDFLAGRIPRALAAYEEAARTIPGGPHPAMVLDHARALREAGILAEAEDVLRTATDRVRRARLFQEVGEIELLRAECALAQDDPGSARRLAGSAARRFAKRGNQRWARKAELLVLRAEQVAASSAGKVRALAGLAERTAAFADRCREESRDDLARRADLLAAACRLQAGQDLDATPRLHSGDPLPLRLLTHEVRALGMARAGDEAKALTEVRRGLAQLGSFQRTFGSLDLRTAGAVHGVSLARLGIDLAVRRGKPAGVVEMVEHGRAISSRLPQLRPPRDPDTARMLAELRGVEEEARGLEGDPETAAEAARLRKRASQLQRDIRARAWELEGDSDQRAGRSSTDAPRLADLRGAVDETGSAFVTYVLHGDSWVAVLVRRDGARLAVEAPAGEVAALVRRVRADLDAAATPYIPDAIAASIRASLGRGLARLDALLVEPLHLDGEPLVVSASGPLAVLPWSLLPSRLGVPTVVTPGAGTWLRARTATRPARPAVTALSGPGLHESEKEARDVAGTWMLPNGDADLLVGDEATTAAAHQALARSDLMHVAAHGTHRADSPLFSSVRLADGPLYAYELDPDEGMPSCVTLSACEAGLATLRPGDEGLGLTHVLLHVGVASVVAGVARVRDDVAAAVMRDVHRAMSEGASSAEALAAAQLAHAQDVATGSPAPPAPFVTFGAPW
jgi:tetratricopeptide (TPR) repeat protein